MARAPLYPAVQGSWSRRLPLARVMAWLVALLSLGLQSPSAHADGRLVQGDQLLLEVDQTAPCREGAAACDAYLVRQLSGYRFVNGYVDSGAWLQRFDRGWRASGLVMTRLSAARLLLPGGDFNFGELEALFASPPSAVRLGFSAVDIRTGLFCRDSLYGGLHGPLEGPLRHYCSPDQRWALDASVAKLQWDRDIERVAVQWLELGPSLELLGNGHGYQRLLRSLTAAATADVRSMYFDEQPARPASRGRLSVEGNLVLRFLWRSPTWELNGDARYRTLLAGGGRRALSDYQGSVDLRLVRNVLIGDAFVLRPGARLNAGYAANPELAFGSLASVTDPWSAFIGMHIGILHSAIGI